MKRREFFESTLALLAATAASHSVLADTNARPRTGNGGSFRAVTITGQEIVIPRREIIALRKLIGGAVLMRDEKGYDSARKVWNGAFDRRPAVIARCKSATDVSRVVEFAREYNLLTAVRGGGHSLSGQSVCDGGLVIDLSHMRGVTVDPVKLTARAEGGALISDVDRATQTFGLATPTGTVSHTGMGGLTLGGGYGHIGRKYGLTCDNLKSVDIVTADGRLVRASKDEHPDLFWAARGGGGNFGVATAFEYQLHDIGTQTYAGALVYPFDAAPELLKFFAEFSEQMPDEYHGEAMFTIAPNGDRLFILEPFYLGSPEVAERALQPLRQFRKPLQDTLRMVPYVELQRIHDPELPPGGNHYVKGTLMKSIEPGVIEAAMSGVQKARHGVANFMIGQVGGGAVGRVAPDATAYVHRDAIYNIVVQASWDSPEKADEAKEWARGVSRAVQPYSKGFYANLVTLEGPARDVSGAYGANLPRLTTVKRQYDPTNLFRLNANIAVA